MDDDGTAEEGIGHGVQRPGGERCDCERDEGDGEEAFKGPVVGTVGGAGG